MKNDLQYRWSIKTSNVYDFLMFEHAGTIASYKNEVSGWVSKKNVRKFLYDLNKHINSEAYSNLKFVTSARYWANYDKYNN